MQDFCPSTVGGLDGDSIDFFLKRVVEIVV